MANLFLHYAFDMWMRRNHPSIPFERYADDILCHCDSERHAQELKEALAKRFAECGLELHPDKTKIVYCKDDDRRGDYPEQKFDFLGYTFRARRSKNHWGKHFVNFSPGVSNAATKAIRQEIRAWQLRCRVDKRIDDMARMFNPIIRGWMNYYGRYYKSALYPTLRHLDRCLARWAMSKYKRLRRRRRRAEHWVREVLAAPPRCWPIGRCCTRRRLDGKSRMSGDAHVRICERLGGNSPGRLDSSWASRARQMRRKCSWPSGRGWPASASRSMRTRRG
ncbi:group II intron maturase-specific domain-containing protein [Bradyrhizobium sp. CCBAU 21362]|uniref:group II intron maturase-specific domain-containing protein n=1 Tax=Bradyrhizobium sp. CCBAU 21362 TaxID=1325082 RepID=UPI002304DCD7|nr:group II intron maturase-specific domain-containing protein [Bradyrhizobium sp. CCBAU 21362]